MKYLILAMIFSFFQLTFSIEIEKKIGTFTNSPKKKQQSLITVKLKKKKGNKHYHTISQKYGDKAKVQVILAVLNSKLNELCENKNEFKRYYGSIAPADLSFKEIESGYNYLFDIMEQINELQDTIDEAVPYMLEKMPKTIININFIKKKLANLDNIINKARDVWSKLFYEDDLLFHIDIDD